MKKYLIASDIHFPAHSPQYVDILLEAVKDFDVLILNGDVADLYGASSHPKEWMPYSLEDELEIVRDFLTELREANKDLKIVYLMGNHEDRFDRYLRDNASAIRGLLYVHSELGLDELNIEHYPYQYEYRIGETNAYVMHSPPSYSINAANTSLGKKPARTYIYGCTHRPDRFVKRVCGKDGTYIAEVLINGCGADYNSSFINKNVFKYYKNHSISNKSMITVTEIDGEAICNLNIMYGNKISLNGIIYESNKENDKWQVD